MLALHKHAEQGWDSREFQPGSDADQPCNQWSRAAPSDNPRTAQPATPFRSACATLFVMLVVAEDESMSEGQRTSL